MVAWMAPHMEWPRTTTSRVPNRSAANSTLPIWDGATMLPATLVSVLVVVAVEFGLARQFGVETPLIGDYGGARVSDYLHFTLFEFSSLHLLT
jgi:hypothetical protein